MLFMLIPTPPGITAPAACYSSCNSSCNRNIYGDDTIYYSMNHVNRGPGMRILPGEILPGVDIDFENETIAYIEIKPGDYMFNVMVEEKATGTITASKKPLSDN
ncbi:MAG: hypothetical protein U0L10_00430 [Lachnospiraceae bacterium]|nr:hypothetical protein [Lachnospiraceae bacterium]